MKLILMRGISGSGKTTKAREILKENPEAVILSTDDLFIVEGQYVFDPSKLDQNHKMNQERCHQAMTAKTKTIIIDNTNIQIWEMIPYHKLAQKHGYETHIIEINPPTLSELLHRQETRGDKKVPEHVITRTLNKWRPGITVQDLSY